MIKNHKIGKLPGEVEAVPSVASTSCCSEPGSNRCTLSRITSRLPCIPGAPELALSAESGIAKLSACVMHNIPSLPTLWGYE